ncbi:MAG: FAD-dependent oxidoreductase [Planctomycetota bacterium]|nr:FAD-dependent oxidoreductase [Planctomycetota bacterium]
MTGRDFDVLVVGGGPAGAWCAFHLARGGVRVALLQPPRRHAKVCGGCLTAPAWDEIGRPESLDPTPVREAVFEWAGRFRAAVPVDGDAVLVDRERLDAHLLARAREAGAEVFEDRARRVRRSGARWTAQTAGAAYQAAVLVGADGCRSLVRAAVVGKFRPSEMAFGAGVYPAWQDLAVGAGARGMARTVFFPGGLSVKPAGPRRHGYAYVFGQAERASVGVWGRGPARAVLALLRHVLAGWLAGPAGGAYRVLGRSSPCIVSPAGFDGRTASDFGRCAGANWMLVGDAAGHVNPVTGEGIRYALRGGRLAAEAILDGSPTSFRDRWEADYGEVLRWGARLVQIHERSHVVRRWIRRAGRSPVLARALADLGFARGSYRWFYLTGFFRGMRQMIGW